MCEWAVSGVFVGKARMHWDGKPPSAIAKSACSGAVVIGNLGLSGDEQADLAVHGGPDKALHIYPETHYAYWRSRLDRDDLHPGAFGENLTVAHLEETEACIGDICKLGTATVQISQGRQPCWKLNAHTNEPRMAYLFQETGRTGWYYRVLHKGAVEVGDRLSLVERRNPEWSVEKVTRARLTKVIQTHEAAALANLNDLATGWRKAFARMADGELTENTRLRLEAPT